jgi:hypothetical protein
MIDSAIIKFITQLVLEGGTFNQEPLVTFNSVADTVLVHASVS